MAIHAIIGHAILDIAVHKGIELILGHLKHSEAILELLRSEPLKTAQVELQEALHSQFEDRRDELIEKAKSNFVKASNLEKGELKKAKCLELTAYCTYLLGDKSATRMFIKQVLNIVEPVIEAGEAVKNMRADSKKNFLFTTVNALQLSVPGAVMMKIQHDRFIEDADKAKSIETSIKALEKGA